jgi:hypothetical protein
LDSSKFEDFSVLKRAWSSSRGSSLLVTYFEEVELLFVKDGFHFFTAAFFSDFSLA